MIEKIRKAGIITKGIVYTLVGVLTLMAALGIGGKVSGKNGVINFLENQSFGNVLIVIIGIGLVAYAVWRLCSAFLDSKNEGSDKKAYVKRTGYFVNGAAYATLGVSTIMAGFNSGGSSSSKNSIAAKVLEKSWGEAAFYILAVILLGVGAYQFYKGFKKKFLKDIDNTGNIESREVLEKSGRIGFIARGISFVIFAWFVYKAANQENASIIKGTEEMFTYLLALPMGSVLMGLMAIGFIAYGIFQYFLARYSNVYS